MRVRVNPFFFFFFFSDAEALAAKWREEYVATFPEREASERFFVMSPGPGACSVVPRVGG